MDHLTLSEIWIYPIKSLGGIRLKHSLVEEKGLQFDRRWMLIDADGDFLTQRLMPKMALFKVSMEANGLSVTYNNESIEIPYHFAGGIAKEAVIWDDKVEVVTLSASYDTWFSERLGRACSLVSFPQENPRPVDLRYQINNEHVSLADAYPLLIIGEQSLVDLNNRLEQPLPMNRFRPNLVFSGGQPYEEDTWKEFRVGMNRFMGVKPCARCTVPTVDQETGIRGKEPLVTLATYRKRESKVLFGQNVIAIDHGKISEGDIIELA